MSAERRRPIIGLTPDHGQTFSRPGRPPLPRYELKRAYPDAIVRAGTAHASAVGGRTYFVTDGERINTWEFLAKLAEIFDAPPIARRVSPTTAAVMASVMDGVWRFPPLARRYPPPISRYSLSLLTLTSTYTLAAAERDLGYVPKVALPTGLEKLRHWIDEIGGVDEYLRLVRS